MRRLDSRHPSLDTPTGIPSARPVSFLTLFPSIMVPMFMAMIDQTIVAAALPSIAAELGSVDRVSWVVVFYLMATAMSAPVSGRLADALGRRKLMTVALLLSMLGSILSALAPTLELLVASRVLQGLGGGGLMAISQALIGQSVPPRERARYQGYIAAVAVSASALGPVLGGILTDLHGWRSVFLINLPLGLLAIWLMKRLPAAGTPPSALRFDWRGLILFNAVIWTLLGIVNELREPWSASPPLLGGLALGALAAVALLIRRETRASNPLLPIPLLRNPSIWRSNALTMCHGALVVSLITYVPFYLRTVHEASASAVGMLMLPLMVGIGLGSMVTGRIVSRTGRTALLPSIGLVMVTALLAYLVLHAPTMSVTGVAWHLGLVAIFMGSVMGVVHVTVMSEAGSEFLGTVSGAVQLSRSLGAALGTAVVGVVLYVAGSSAGIEMNGTMLATLQEGGAGLTLDEPFPGAQMAQAFRAVFLAIGLFAACGAVLAWTIPRRRI